MLYQVQIDRLCKPIEAQTIFFQLDNRQQAPFEVLELHRIDTTFENRFLHPLANALTSFGYATQPSPPFTGCGGNIVTNDDQHRQRATNGR